MMLTSTGATPLRHTAALRQIPSAVPVTRRAVPSAALGKGAPPALGHTASAATRQITSAAEALPPAVLPGGFHHHALALRSHRPPSKPTPHQGSVVELRPLRGSRPLTARETEIASMASQRWTDRVIADALYISVRTVESHLASVYRKLGVRSRRELTTVRTAS